MVKKESVLIRGNWDKFLTFFRIWGTYFWRHLTNILGWTFYQWFFLSLAFCLEVTWKFLLLSDSLWPCWNAYHTLLFGSQVYICEWKFSGYIIYLQGKISGSRFFHVTLQTLDKFFLVLSHCLKMLSKALPSRYLLAQSQKWKHQHNVWNMFKVNYKNTRMTSMTSFWYFHS